MVKEDISDMYSNLYRVWMKQSEQFYESANQNLKFMFDQKSFNPEDNLKAVNKWLEILKQQWQFAQLTEEQKPFANYWALMSKMCNEATDKMLHEWIKRSRSQNPITSIHDLYELWLDCCHEIYKKSLDSKAYQDAYSDFVNAAFKFWESYVPKR